MAKESQVGAKSKINQSDQEMNNQGFDEKYLVPGRLSYAEDQSTTPHTLRRRQVDIPRTIAMEYSGENPTYIGRAAPGTGKGAVGWQIQKLTYSGSNVTDIQWADGDLLFNNIWDNRGSLSYS